MWLVKPLSDDGLENISNHKYKAGTYTPIDNILNAWWAWACEFLPMWMAPNLVTLIALFFMIFSYCLLWFYSPTFTEAPPWWVFVVSAVCLFIYQTLDAMDGKQARRTGSSSPLGQLFDHGIDCLCNLAHHSLMCAFLVPGCTPMCLAVLAALDSGFYLAQLEEYFTGVLPTASFAGNIGVTELQFGLIFACLMEAAVGPKTVQSFMNSVSHLPVLGQVTFTEMVILPWVGLSFIAAAISYYNILRHPSRSERCHTLKNLVAYSSPIVLLDVLLFSWDTRFLMEHGRLIVFCTGLLFFYYTVQVIIYSMAKEPVSVLHFTLIPYGLLAYSSRGMQVEADPDVVEACLIAFTIFIFFRIFHWLISVMFQIKQKLGIHAFSLAPDEPYIPAALQEESEESSSDDD